MGQTVATRGDGHVLDTIDIVGDRRRVGACPGLPFPELCARPRIVGAQRAVGMAHEDHAAGRGQSPAADPEHVGRLDLPDDPVGVRVDGAQGAAKLGPQQRRDWASAEVEQAGHEVLGLILPSQGPGPDIPGDVEVPGLWVVGHGGLDSPSLEGGLKDRRNCPERLEDAGGAREARHRSGALGNRGVTDRVGLRGRRGLSGVLGHRLLSDADEWLAVRAVQQVDPPGLADLADGMAQLAAHHHVE